MFDIDPRGAALRAFDAAAASFVQDCAHRLEAGGASTQGEVRKLADLGERLAADLTAWDQAVADLHLARQTRLRPGRAGQLLIESVFDEVLEPDATRLLAAALDLARGAS